MVLHPKQENHDMNSQSDIDLDRVRDHVHHLMRTLQLLGARFNWGTQVDAGPGAPGPVNIKGMAKSNLEAASLFLIHKILMERLDVDVEDKMRAIQSVSSSLEQATEVPQGMFQIGENKVKEISC